MLYSAYLSGVDRVFVLGGVAIVGVMVAISRVIAGKFHGLVFGGGLKVAVYVVAIAICTDVRADGRSARVNDFETAGVKV